MEERIRTLGSLHTRHFAAHLDLVRLRDGTTTERMRIEHPVAAAILACPEPGRVLLVRQHRYALGCETLEIPAGKTDPGETALACAVRELREETGFEAASLAPLIRFAPAIGYSDEVIEIFLASGVRRVSDEVDGREIAGVEILPLAEALRLVREGVILDAKTIIGLQALRGAPEGPPGS